MVHYYLELDLISMLLTMRFQIKYEVIELDGIVISIYWILYKYSLNINEWFWMLEPFI